MFIFRTKSNLPWMHSPMKISMNCYVLKKIVLTLLAISLLTIIITSVSAQCIPTPPCGTPGRTPGFWKHNIGVYLGLRNGNYSSPWEEFDKELWPVFLEYLATEIPIDLLDAYNILNTGGGGAIAEARHATADLFNAAAGLTTLYD